jgi:Uma2 family endonuclease
MRFAGVEALATATKTHLMTALEFMAADLGDGTFELVRGEVVEMAPPPMPEHGFVCANVAGLLWHYGRQSGHGFPLSNDSGVLTERDPDSVRGPDVCFYSHARWPRAQVGNTLPPVPPDLAVEVVSPGNRNATIMKKVFEYLEAGVALVWVLYPKRRQVVMYRAADDELISLHEHDVIENLPELPGFRCSVSDFFV